MTSHEYLTSKGWKRIGEKRIDGFKHFECWTHDDHQHSSRAFFTGAAAVAHQRELDKGWTCSCVPKEPAPLHEKETDTTAPRKLVLEAGMFKGPKRGLPIAHRSPRKVNTQ